MNKMRLWHKDLIVQLPCSKTANNSKYNQLGGQHRECCALRGNGWGKKHSTIDYIYNNEYGKEHLIAFHLLVIKELENRGWNIDNKWKNYYYRGSKCIEFTNQEINYAYINNLLNFPELIFDKEHNNIYYNECLENLEAKGVKLL